jgi:hypothetical protein
MDGWGEGRERWNGKERGSELEGGGEGGQGVAGGRMDGVPVPHRS